LPRVSPGWPTGRVYVLTGPGRIRESRIIISV
jgi:hypothetical protein